MTSSSPPISVTLRCYPRPPPAPPRLRTAASDQQAAHRLVYAAAFAPSAGEVNLRDVEESSDGSFPAAATNEATAPRLDLDPDRQSPLHHIPPLSFYQRPGPSATQPSILRRRPTDELIGTQTQDGARSKKRVRLESPIRSTKEAAASARVVKPSIDSSSRGRNSLRFEQEVTVEVEPPTSNADQDADVTGLVERYDDPAEGALQRCVPFPYRHLEDHRPSTQNPARQHPAKIRHSFLDPSPNGLPPPSPSRNARLYPSALTSLAPGRRGAWIIPISGPLPISQTSAPIWRFPPTFVNGLAAPVKPPKASKDKLKAIEWTDGRLIALWTVLTSLHERAPMGEVKASCFLSASADHPATSPPPAQPSHLSLPLSFPPAPSPSSWPDHIRIAGDAHLALPLRSLISIVTAQQSSRKEDQLDKEKFLDGTRLVWVDEAGRPILTA